MAKKIKEIRTEELLQAALTTIQEVGIANTTVAMVAHAAGMAPGMVHHYFKNKDAVIEGALRYTNARHRDEILELTRGITCPKQRLFKIVDANFDPHRFNKGMTRMWITFCAQVPFNAQFARIQHALHQRMHSNLKYNFRLLLDEPTLAENAAFELSNLIDGLWLRAAVQQTPIDPQLALQTTDNFLARLGIER